MQALAFSAIRERLTPGNIVHEVFSEFTSRYVHDMLGAACSILDHTIFMTFRYPAIREMELDYLCEQFNNPAIRDSLQAISQDLVNGDFPSAGRTLGLLLSQRIVMVNPPTQMIQADDYKVDVYDEPEAWPQKKAQKIQRKRK